MGPPKRTAELIQAEGGKRSARCIEVGTCIHIRVANELEEAAVQLIGPGLGDDVNHRTRVAPHIGAVEVGLDLELAHRVDRGSKRTMERVRPLVVIYAVIKKVVVAFAVAVGKDLGAGALVIRPRAAHDGSGWRLSHAVHSRTERRQLYEVAAVQRQLIHQLVVNHGSYR